VSASGHISFSTEVVVAKQLLAESGPDVPSYGEKGGLAVGSGSIAAAVRLWRDEQGTAMFEYAILLALIAVMALGGLVGVGARIVAFWESLRAALGARFQRPWPRP
jgi:Flp pilus assembly pilin Flp